MKIRSLRGDDGSLLAAINRGEAVYCGRFSAARGLTGSPLGNPYHVRNYKDVAEVITLYRRWLWKKLEAGEVEVVKALQQLTSDSVLVCWCCNDDTPEACRRGQEQCHCHVIVKARAWWVEVKQQVTQEME